MKLLYTLSLLAMSTSAAFGAINTPIQPIGCVNPGDPKSCALHWYTNTGFRPNLKDPNTLEAYAIATLYDPNCKEVFTTPDGLSENRLFSTPLGTSFILNSYPVENTKFGKLDLPRWTFMVHNYDGGDLCTCFTGVGYHDCRCPFQCL